MSRYVILTTSRVSRGVVPLQNRSSPSSVKIRYAQWNELRYCVRASRVCIRVFTTLYTEKSIIIVVNLRDEIRTRGAWSYTLLQVQQ